MFASMASFRCHLLHGFALTDCTAACARNVVWVAHFSFFQLVIPIFCSFILCTVVQCLSCLDQQHLRFFFVLTPSTVALTSHTEISFMQSILYSSASGASHLVLSVQRVGHFNCCLSTLPSKEPSATSIADWHSTRWNNWAFLWAMATPVMLILLF